MQAEHYLCGTAGHQNPCQQRAGGETCPECLDCRKPGSPQRARRRQDRPLLSLPACREKYPVQAVIGLHTMAGFTLTNTTLHNPQTYLECVTKSYVGTSTVLPSTMFFRVVCIKSLSKASARGRFKEEQPYVDAAASNVVLRLSRPEGKTLSSDPPGKEQLTTYSFLPPAI